MSTNRIRHKDGICMVCGFRPAIGSRICPHCWEHEPEKSWQIISHAEYNRMYPKPSEYRPGKSHMERD
jgi:hypothetical protein